ncbi:hypothetical protein PLICRDRAFT_42569 [Plicaturopsis crispa FD-325 SS-3]|nr:hypothetical protein PLICRDRAFT_42569 [Plicaturopsis crispa FD-325 SS-3]
MPAYRTRDTSLTRPLEVATETPEPPTLTIISPTPRAFTFPVNSNTILPQASTSSPYSSPSSSPFEPDLHTLAFTPSPPNGFRTLSPVSSATSVSSSAFSSPTTAAPPTHKRRKSSISSESERRPKKGDDDYVKRPENAFILFRRRCCEERQAAQAEAASSAEGPAKKQRQADLSKTISQQWKCLPADERHYWEELAKEKKKEHEQLHPGYVYRPQRTKDKDGRSKGKKVLKGRRGEDQETDSESLSFAIPWPAPSNRHGRSASAPTPPLGYQTIQVPSLYMPSCPTSPSLMPMINRRTSHPGHDEQAMSFDYLPSHSYMPPSFGQGGDFESNMQSSEFFQGMFDVPQQSENTTPLQHLTIPDQPHFAPSQQQMLSPLSATSTESTSSPSSPHNGPFTPISGVLESAFSMMSHGPVEPSMSEPSMGVPMPELEYPSYEWDGHWPDGTEMLLGNDFDLSAIPPIELGMSKYDGDMGQSSAPSADYSGELFGGLDEGHHYQEGGQTDDASFEGLFEFNDMMAGQGF